MKEQQHDGSIELTQQVGLIEQVLNALGSLNQPSMEPYLYNEGDPCNINWSYTSVVGMLMYLLPSHLRPTISFAAVHQCVQDSCSMYQDTL